MRGAVGSVTAPRTLALAWLIGLASGMALAQGTSTGTTAGAVPGNAARAATAAGATSAAPSTQPQATSGVTVPANSTGARFVESCQQGIDRGVSNLGCQGPLYASEIARLKEEALRTNNPSLLTLLGDAYQSNRSAVSDIGQAYRWYLLGAVRGDPRAMQRLSDLYKNGRGAPQDNIKALGYARLTQRLAPPGSTSAQQATEVIGSLGNEMAAEEVVLADRFATELERTIRQQSGATDVAQSQEQMPAAPAGPGRAGSLTSRLPGMGAVQHDASPQQPAAATPSPTAGGGIPGQQGASPRTP